MKPFRTLAMLGVLVAVVLLPSVTSTRHAAADGLAGASVWQSQEAQPVDLIPIYGVPGDTGTRVMPPGPAGFTAQSVTFSVTYNGFSQSAQTAFQAAVDIWAATLTSSVPIVVNANWTNLGAPVNGSVVLGSAGPHLVLNNATNTLYPTALASKLAGFDVLPGVSDIDADFNSNAGVNWYFGTDGNCPPGQIDFVSVVLHELGHGLGFASGFSYSGSPPSAVGSTLLSGFPLIFGRGVVNSSTGTSQNLVSSFTSPSTDLATQFTNNSQYWNGPNTTAANGGNNARLYAPTTWSPGSSMSHMSESTYPAGNADSLMTPSLSGNEVIHSPGPITLGIFADMGWTIASGGTATKLAFSQSPGNSTSGVAFASQPTVRVRDALDNLVSSDNSTQVLLSVNGAGSLSCTTNPLTVTGGIASFSGCSITGAAIGTSLHATATGLTAADSSTFNVIGPAAKLAFTSSPGSGFAGTAFGTQPVVVVRDSLNQLVSGDSGRAVTLGASGGAGALSCTTNPASTTGGTATFAGCSISLAGTYTLSASASGLTGAGTSSFTLSTPPPAAPTYLPVSNATTTSVTINFTDNATSEAGYGLLRLGGGGGFEKVADLASVAGSGNQISFTDGVGTGPNAPLVPGTYYAYWVYAYSTAGDPGTGRVFAGSYMTVIAPAGLPLPPAPTSATGTGTTTTHLTWVDQSNNESGFRIHRYNTGTSTWDAVGTAPADATSFDDSGLAANTAYAYWIVAYNSGGDAYANAYITANTTAGSGGVAPVNQGATAVSASSVSIAWQNNNVPGAVGYQVIRLGPGGWQNAGPAVPPDATSFTDTGAGAAGALQGAAYYAYWVYAFTVAGDPGAGRVYAGTFLTVITPFGLPAAPVPLSANGSGQHAITIGWIDASNNEQGFRVLKYVAGAWNDISGLLPAGTTSYTDTTPAAGAAGSYWVVAQSSGGLYSYAAAYISANAYP